MRNIQNDAKQQDHEAAMISAPTWHMPNDEDNIPLYRKVERYVEKFIETEGLQPGDPIPSLTELMKQLDASALTIRRAIHELCQRQILFTHQGRGTFVSGGVARRVLWVSGLDIFGGDVSPFYTELFRAASEECGKRAIKLEPVWLPSGKDFKVTVKAHGGEALISGYIFVGCRKEHKLLRHIEEAGKPYVSLSRSHFGSDWSVVPDIPQAIKMAWEHFHKGGHEKIAVIQIEGNQVSLEKAGFSPKDFHTCPRGPGASSDVETWGYLTALELLRNNELPPAVYVTDDILARGVSRAILEIGPRPLSFDFVAHAISRRIPQLGFPATFLLYDIQEQVTSALDILSARISEVPVKEVAHLCKFQKVFISRPDSTRAKTLDTDTKELHQLATASS